MKDRLLFLIMIIVWVLILMPMDMQIDVATFVCYWEEIKANCMLLFFGLLTIFLGNVIPISTDLIHSLKVCLFAMLFIAITFLGTFFY